MTPLTSALKKLADSFKALNNGKYFVRRGAIMWAGFNFEANPYAVSIQLDEAALFNNNAGFKPTKISIELATALNDNNPVEPEIDDDAIEGLITDTQDALTAWTSARDSNGDPYVIKLERLSASAVEFHDPVLRVQGIVVSLNVDI